MTFPVVAACGDTQRPSTTLIHSVAACVLELDLGPEAQFESELRVPLAGSPLARSADATRCPDGDARYVLFFRAASGRAAAHCGCQDGVVTCVPDVSHVSDRAARQIAACWRETATAM